MKNPKSIPRDTVHSKDIQTQELSPDKPDSCDEATGKHSDQCRNNTAFQKDTYWKHRQKKLKAKVDECRVSETISRS